LYVTVSPGHGYESVFIFECKNWQSKVGKNEIVIFAEKIRAANAQRGFFVAAAYTADAVAQAAQDDRLELLAATELDPSAVMIPSAFHTIRLGETTGNILVRASGEPKGQTSSVDLESTSITIDGQ